MKLQMTTNDDDDDDDDDVRRLWQQQKLLIERRKKNRAKKKIHMKKKCNDEEKNTTRSLYRQNQCRRGLGQSDLYYMSRSLVVVVVGFFFTTADKAKAHSEHVYGQPLTPTRLVFLLQKAARHIFSITRVK